MIRRNLSRILLCITGTAFVADAICGVLVCAIAAYPDAVPDFPGRAFLGMLSGKIAEEPLYAVPLMIMNGVCVVVGVGMIAYGALGKKKISDSFLYIFSVLGIITALFRPFTPYLGPADSPAWAGFFILKAAACIAGITITCIGPSRVSPGINRKEYI